MMKCSLLIFNICAHFLMCVCLVNVFGITEAAGDACALPNGAWGKCMALPACAQYVALLKETTTTELGLKLSRDRRCGLEGNNPKVCCPTETEVPEPIANVRTELNDPDYVDMLPEPGVCGVQHHTPVFQVWDGLPVKTRQQAPWMAILAYKVDSSTWTWECGGSIITKRHVLTAAHCITDSLYVVRVGELDLEETNKEFQPIDFYIKKKIRHEQYTQYHNDIGILVLDGNIPIDDPNSAKFIAPVCLPEPGFPYKKKMLSTFITVWGEKGKNGERPTHLLYAHLDLLSQDTCKNAFKDEAFTIDGRVFCAGDLNNGRDACNGNSGGPLIANYLVSDYRNVFYYQIGLILFGYSCSALRYTGVYTNITHFMPWILEKVTGKGPRKWPYTTKAPLVDFGQY